MERRSRDRALFVSIVSSVGIDREVTFSHGEEPDVVHCAMEVQDFGSAGVARCHVASVGADIASRMDEVVRRGYTLVEVFINAGTATSPWAVEQLRRSGFFVAGLVPQWFGADAILMLRLTIAIDTDSINVWSDDGKKLANAVIDRYRRSFL